MRIELEQPDKEKKTTPSDSFIPPKDEKRTPVTEFKKMKAMGWKEGWKYFLDYYRNATLVTIFIAICAISLTVSIIQNKRPYVIQINICNNYIDEDTDTDAFCEAFAEHMGTDLKSHQMMFSASDYFNPQEASEEMSATIYKFAAMVASSDLDIAGGNRDFIDYYGYGMEDSIYFMDLKEALPDDLYRKLDAEGRIYMSKYTDETGKAIGEYACAIDVSNSRLTDEAGLLVTPCYLGIIINTKRLDTAVEFFRWIFYMDGVSAA